MQQGSLFDDIPELRFFETVFENCRKIAKRRYPCQLKAEDRTEYIQLLKDETRLEFAEHLRKLADNIEQNTLKRQKNTINILYEKMDAIE